LIFQGKGEKAASVLGYSVSSGCRGRWFKSSRPDQAQKSPKWDLRLSAPYPAFCLEAAQVAPFSKQTLSSARKIPLKLNGGATETQEDKSRSQE
jgi:hypothetical protein